MFGKHFLTQDLTDTFCFLGVVVASSVSDCESVFQSVCTFDLFIDQFLRLFFIIAI